MTRERSSQRGSATSGFPSASIPSAWMRRWLARSIGSATRAVGLGGVAVSGGSCFE
jgi:hypothetical protein